MKAIKLTSLLLAGAVMAGCSAQKETKEGIEFVDSFTYSTMNTGERTIINSVMGYNNLTSYSDTFTRFSNTINAVRSQRLHIEGKGDKLAMKRLYVAQENRIPFCKIRYALEADIQTNLSDAEARTIKKILPNILAKYHNSNIGCTELESNPVWLMKNGQALNGEDIINGNYEDTKSTVEKSKEYVSVMVGDEKVKTVTPEMYKHIEDSIESCESARFEFMQMTQDSYIISYEDYLKVDTAIARCNAYRVQKLIQEG